MSAAFVGLAFALLVYRRFDPRVPRRWFQFQWWAPLIGAIALDASFAIVMKACGADASFRADATALLWVGGAADGVLVGLVFGIGHWLRGRLVARASRLDASRIPRQSGDTGVIADGSPKQPLAIPTRGVDRRSLVSGMLLSLGIVGLGLGGYYLISSWRTPPMSWQADPVVSARRRLGSVLTVIGKDPTKEGLSLGSGFVVGDSGLCVTNYHVVAGAESIAVSLQDGTSLEVVEVVAYDTTADICIFRVGRRVGGLVELPRTLAPLQLDVRSVTVGERIAVAGSPEGLEQTLSDGLVSATRDSGPRELIQITAPISHGSSGGPVINGSGRVCGVVRLMITEGQNLNFAIPASVVAEVLRHRQPLAVDEFYRRTATPAPGDNPYAQNDTEPTERDYFTLGSTKAEVLLVQGEPTHVHHSDSPNATYRDSWWYGNSMVCFDDDGRVDSWSDASRDEGTQVDLSVFTEAERRQFDNTPLKAQMPPSPHTKGFFTVGSTKAEVLALQGTPTGFQHDARGEEKWLYGESSVRFVDGHVMQWWGTDLKARPAPR